MTPTPSSTPSTPPTRLPEGRDRAAPYAIAFVCLGNICRSPTAAVVMHRKLEAAGLGRATLVHSAGTGDWHVGEQMDRRAAATLVAHDYDPTRHRATQFDASWFDQHDLVLVMDHHNLQDVRALTTDEAHHGRVLMFRAFDPLVDESLDVPDPWYGGQQSFDEVLAIVERTCDVLVAALSEQLPATGARPGDR